MEKNIQVGMHIHYYATTFCFLYFMLKRQNLAKKVVFIATSSTNLFCFNGPKQTFFTETWQKYTNCM
jgi:hypothetical protein